MERTEAYKKAKKRAEAKLGFFIHLTVYVGVILLLIVINLITSAGSLWFQWPMLGWGIGLAFHALAVFVFPEGSAITEQMIEREMERERQGG